MPRPPGVVAATDCSPSARIGPPDGRRTAGARLVDVVDAVEAELDVLVANVEECLLAPMRARIGAPATTLRQAVHRGVSAAVRDALARLRYGTELPEELLPDLIELARLSAGAPRELPELPDPWLVGLEVFWDHFQVAAERTLGDPALCWEVSKVARLRLRGHPARLSRLVRRARERESVRLTGENGESRLRAVMRALDGLWVDPGELGYDLTGHHVAMVAETSPSPAGPPCRTHQHVLRVQAPDGRTWAWFGGNSRISDDDLDALVASQGSSYPVVAFGEPAEGVAGFAASHRQAVEARAIAPAINHSTVRFADYRVVIAVLRDHDLAQGFIDGELKELACPSERMLELRETLRTYLEHSQSVSSTAVVRRRDRKTIERQLRTAEQLIHHRVSDRSDQVLIALRVAEILRHRD